MSGMSLTKTRHPRPKRVGKNSTFGEKIAAKTHAFLAQVFGGRTILKLVGFLVAVLIIVGGIVWYKAIYSNPERVFWSMLDNNLSTNSITKAINQASSTTINKEQTQLAFSPTPSVRDIKTISAQNGGSASTIKIESIGTPKDTYQHYVLIEQPSKPGKAKADFSEVYPLWLKNSGNKQSEAQLFNGAAYDAVLFGNLPASQRATMLGYLKKAYHTDFSNIKKESNNGRKMYTYSTKVNLRSFANAVNFYSKSLGLPNAGQIKPSNYKATDEVAINLSVDVLSRQLKQTEYVSSQSVENYITYGVSPNFKPPAHTVSYQTLQSTVQKASAQ
jgi:hypothetical protein